MDEQLAIVRAIVLGVGSLPSLKVQASGASFHRHAGKINKRF
jgi:hypothetical protein